MRKNRTFFYLDDFVERDAKKDVNENSFYPLKKEEIVLSQKRLGFSFPSELLQFFLEIGYGFLTTKENAKKRCEFTNRIIDPNSIADIMLLGVDSGQLHPDAEFEPWEMPFFEIGEAASFLVMHPKSDKPNAVYNMLGEMIEESFSKFIWRLYYESPSFYIKEEYTP